MKNNKNFYITTPIYYVNDIPNIGHAYTTLVCDTIARFMRWKGKEVRFLTGTDEHGQKVEKSAIDSSLEPQIFTDSVSKRFKELTTEFNISNDDFIRTTEKRHKKSVQSLWEILVKNGSIYLDEYSGWYSVRDEAFYSEDEILENEKGQKIAPNGSILEWIKEPSFFFKLSSWETKLLEYYKKNPEFISPKSRYNEVLSFVSNGLADLSISRTSFKWGIPVPNSEDHIVYVWLDALTNYISAIEFPNTNSNLWKFWPADVHIVGKDILRFHAIYWPAFLMAAGLEPPKKVFAHGWWTINGEKMSKSTGNVIDPIKVKKEFGLDQFRYFLLREMRFGKDGDFTNNALISRINADLSNDFGNLIQRVLSFVYKNCDKKIPKPVDLMEIDKKIENEMDITKNNIVKLMDDYLLTDSLEEIWKMVKKCNSYIDSQAPWELKKTNLNRMNTVLYVLISLIKKISFLTQSFIPEGSNKILNILSIPDKERGYDFYDKQIKPGKIILEPRPIYPRIDQEKR